MGKIAMYYHAGSGNHGCEAIVRATNKILHKKMSLYSVCPDEDILYGLNSIVDIQQDKAKIMNKKSISYLRAAIGHKIRKDDLVYVSLSHKAFFNDVNPGDIYLSIGGDNYCYPGKDILGYYNEILHKKGAKTVLWGCSFEPKDMNDSIAKDIAKYDLIVARENISYKVLKKANNNTVLLPDPAFLLDKEEVLLPEYFKEGHTIGINVSPLAADCAKGHIVLDNYRKLIQWIIDNTQEQIALIPHVVKPGNDDRIPLQQLLSEFQYTDRVFLIDDCNCMQLKGYISKCRFFIGARTHATIAAYSSCVPTLVAGYSVKAIGIAQELFGTDKHYVISVQDFNDSSDLLHEFQWLIDNESHIKKRLSEFIPEYKSRFEQFGPILNNLTKEQKT